MPSSKAVKRKCSENTDSESDPNYSDSDHDEIIPSNRSCRKIVKKHRLALETDSSTDDEKSDTTSSPSNSNNKNQIETSDEDKPLIKKVLSSKPDKSKELPSDSSEDEPLICKGKKNISNLSQNREELPDEDKELPSSDSSEDEPLTLKGKKNISNLSQNQVESSDEDKPLMNISRSSKSKESPASDSSEDEPLVFNVKKNISNSSQNQLESSDEDEPLVKKDMPSKSVKSEVSDDASHNSCSEDELPAINKELSKNKESTGNSDAESPQNSDAESSDEDESMMKKRMPLKSDKSKVSNESSSSDDELLAKSRDSLIKTDSDSKENSRLKVLSDEESASSLSGKENQESISSDDEPLSTLKTNKKSKENKRVQKPTKNKLKEITNDVPSDEEKSVKKDIKGVSGKGVSKKSSANNKIEHLKKYIRAAGIRIKSYDLLFKDCKSIKAKTEKLLEVLQEKGITGRPTLEKCKNLKKKLERQQEIAQLDTSNIIQTKGRPKRGCRTVECVSAPTPDSPVKHFSRLKGIIDSEESD